MKVWHRLGGRCGANAYQLTMCARAHPPLLCAPSASFARHPLSSSTFLIQFLHPLSSFTLLIHFPHSLSSSTHLIHSPYPNSGPVVLHSIVSPCANPYRRGVNEGALCRPVPIPIGVM